MSDTLLTELGERILDVLRKAPAPLKGMDVARAVGLTAKKDVNLTLYGLNKKGLVCMDMEGQTPMWRIARTLETPQLTGSTPIAATTTVGSPAIQKGREDADGTQLTPAGTKNATSSGTVASPGGAHENQCNFVITDKEEKFEWTGCGLSIKIPNGCLPSTIKSCTLTVAAKLNTDITIPPNSLLASAVYEIKLGPIVQDLHAPVELVMEHCANLKPGQENCLSFIVAKGETPTTFEYLPGGLFFVDNSGKTVGKISVKSFSFLAVIVRYTWSSIWPSIKYCGSVYYENENNSRRFDFLITKDLEIIHEEIKKKVSRHKAFDMAVEFNEPEIVLNMPSNEDGLKFTQCTLPCKVMKSEVDSFDTGKRLPMCTFIAQWISNPPKTPFFKDIHLVGAKYPKIINVDCSIANVPNSSTGPPQTASTPSNIYIKGILNFVKSHPYATAGIVIIGVIAAIKYSDKLKNGVEYFSGLVRIAEPVFNLFLGN